jgi:hypothetical protein
MRGSGVSRMRNTAGGGPDQRDTGVQSTHTHTHVDLGYLYLHQKEHKEQLTHGHHAPHEEANRQGGVELSHNHRPADAQGAQHEARPRGRKAFGKGSRSQDNHAENG